MGKPTAGAQFRLDFGSQSARLAGMETEPASQYIYYNSKRDWRLMLRCSVSMTIERRIVWAKRATRINRFRHQLAELETPSWQSYKIEDQWTLAL